MLVFENFLAVVVVAAFEIPEHFLNILAPMYQKCNIGYFKKFLLLFRTKYLEVKSISVITNRPNLFVITGVRYTGLIYVVKRVISDLIICSL